MTHPHVGPGHVTPVGVEVMVGGAWVAVEPSTVPLNEALGRLSGWFADTGYSVPVDPDIANAQAALAAHPNADSLTVDDVLAFGEYVRALCDAPPMLDDGAPDPDPHGDLSSFSDQEIPF